MISFLGSEKRSSTSFSASNIPKHLEQIFGGSITSSGVAVNEQKALSLTAVWACVSIISRTMATMPLPVYRRIDAKNKEIAYDSPLYTLLQRKPNTEQSAYQWRSLMAVHMLLWGAGISWIEFDRKGQPIGLWPIPPWRASPERTTNGELVYKVRLPDGTTKVFQSSEVVVFASMSTSADRWMSPIQVHRETISAALTVNDFGAKTFSDGINPAGIISGVNFGTPEHQKTLKENYSQYAGLGNAHKLMLVEEGSKFEKVGLPPQDAQYLETRAFAVSDIGRIYQVPNLKLNVTDGSSNWGTGIEEQNIAFLSDSILPYATMWEQELDNKLFFNKKRFPALFPEFNMDGLLRANGKARNEAFKIRLQNGNLNQDEWRAKENDNPLPDGLGEHYYMQMNMSTLDRIIDGTAGKDPSKETESESNEGEENDA
jgi:HK97 family phage portal protein